MNILLRVFPWKMIKLLSIVILIALIVLNFYGLYTNRFYFFKFDNYIFPLLTLAHFVYLYVIWFKVRENEYPDPKMRNLEYLLYIILFIYVFQIFDTIYILSSYSDYDASIIPETFIPMGTLIVTLYTLLIVMTLVSFRHRKVLIGEYKFMGMNDNIDSWQ
ncbi:hypothetical protein OO009_07305 [Flavobacteriaceae bacterium KMM 6897]|nr:hypothetical protein [Flavobacteriaceae bacterium KMM 6897]